MYYLIQLNIQCFFFFLGQEYKFRVMAVNAEGESTPLEGEKSIIAKNPYGKNCIVLCNFFVFRNRGTYALSVAKNCCESPIMFRFVCCGIYKKQHFEGKRRVTYVPYTETQAKTRKIRKKK